MILKPHGARLIVRRDMEEKSAGGIIMPEQSKQVSLIGTVVATGPECEVASVGERVLFARFGFFELPIGGDYKNCLLMNEEDVLANVVEDMKEVSNA